FEQCGSTAAVSRDTAVIGVPNGSTAYVFVRSGGVWTQQATLLADDAPGARNFGSAVGISGNTVVVGAPHDAAAGPDAGAVYVFVREGTNWSHQTKLTAGSAVAL